MNNKKIIYKNHILWIVFLFQHIFFYILANKLTYRNLNTRRNHEVMHQLHYLNNYNYYYLQSIHDKIIPINWLTDKLLSTLNMITKQ